MRLIDADALRKQLVIDIPIASKEKILDMLGDWRSSTLTINTSTDILPCDTLVAGRLPDIEYKLHPATCENCGGRIDKDTMTCCYCGTYYM